MEYDEILCELYTKKQLLKHIILDHVFSLIILSSVIGILVPVIWFTSNFAVVVLVTTVAAILLRGTHESNKSITKPYLQAYRSYDFYQLSKKLCVQSNPNQLLSLHIIESIQEHWNDK